MKKALKREEQIKVSACSSSQGVSMTAMIVVILLELFMLAYTVVNPQLYGSLIWRYRSFYLSLMGVAVAYMLLNLYVKKDVEHRFTLLTIANPLCAVFFYAWALLVTFSDYTVTGIVDPSVFMTFSMVIPLGFYIDARLYSVIVAAADILMLWIILESSGSIGAIINGGIFFIFQLVLGISYLRMKRSAAERIVEERENALVDVLTGCGNRRAYETEISKFDGEPLPADLAYLAIDVDGLKSVNDNHGHAAGDHLIRGTARCIEGSFGKKGQLFRIGGDEFAVLLRADPRELEEAISAYRESTAAWTVENHLPLSTSLGYALAGEMAEGDSVLRLARTADERMYEAKVRYYQISGNDRRKHLPPSVKESGGGQET